MTHLMNQDLIEEVVSEVLSEAAFIFVEVMDEEPVWSEGLLATRLSFSGDADGELLLAANPALGVEFANNLLGLEPGEDPEVDAQGGAALGEVLNIIAGPLLSTWLGEQAVCDIGPPSCSALTTQKYNEQRAKASCLLALETEEGLPLEVSVYTA